MRTFEVPVLICGGGGAGLSASIFLSALGVESMLVERHPTTSHLPKAHYLNQRTMEIFREHGIKLRVAGKNFRIEGGERYVVKRQAGVAVCGEELICRLEERFVKAGIMYCRHLKE